MKRAFCGWMRGVAIALALAGLSSNASGTEMEEIRFQGGHPWLSRNQMIELLNPDTGEGESPTEEVSDSPLHKKGGQRDVSPGNIHAVSAGRNFDITIAMQQHRSDAERAKIGASITNFAKGVYEMTEGHHFIGKVSIFENPGNLKADIHWSSATVDSGGKQIRASTGHSWGKSTCIKMNDFGLQNAEVSGGILTHEWGHYEYGFKDEYKEPIDEEKNDYLNQPHTTDIAVIGSLMAGWNSRVPFKEQCNLSYALDDSLDDKQNQQFQWRLTRQTAQYRVFGQSCLEQLVNPVAPKRVWQTAWIVPSGFKMPKWPEFSGINPKNPPKIDLDSQGETKALRYLNIVWEDAQKPMVAFCIDRSGSMSSVQLANAKANTKREIDKLQEGAMVEVLAFDSCDSISRIVPFTKLTVANKAGIKAKVDNIASGDMTALWDAAGMALADMQTHDANGNCVKSLLLMTDGIDNDSYKETYSSIVQKCQEMGVAFNSISYGQKADSNLASASAATGGKNFASSDSLASLSSAFSRAGTHGSDRGALVDSEGVVGTTGTWTETFTMDSSATNLMATVTLSVRAANACVVLVSPSGRQFPADSTVDVGGESSWVFMQGKPAVGMWKVIVTAPQGTSAGCFVDASAVAEPPRLMVWMDESEMVVCASVSHEAPVDGARVRAVINDNGTKREVPFKGIGGGTYVLALSDCGAFQNGFSVRADAEQGLATYTYVGVMSSGPVNDEGAPIPESFTRSEWLELSQFKGVVFDACGGSPSMQTQAYKVGQPFGTLPATPLRQGYSFQGWYTAASGGSRVVEETVVTTSMSTLYAHWMGCPNLAPYTATARGWPAAVFATGTQGGTNTMTSFKLSDTVYLNFAYINSGAASAGSHQVSAAILNSSGTTVTNWTWNEGSLSNNFYRWRANVAFTVKTAGKYTARVTLDPNGQVAESNEGDNAYSTTFEVVAPTLSGLAISGSASVASGNSATYTCTASYSDGTSKRVSPTWTLYSGGTYGRITSGGVFTASETTVERSVTIQATYGGKTARKTVTVEPKAVQTVTFDRGDGTAAAASRTYVIGEQYGSFPAATLAGQAFLGWFTHRVGGTQVLETDTVPPWTPRTLFAHWTTEQRLGFNANGGTGANTLIFTAIGGTYPSLPVASRPGYAFVGWYTTASGGSRVQEGDTVTAMAERTLYAHWTRKQVLYFDGVGGEPATVCRTNTIGAAYGKFPTATLAGQALLGWFTHRVGGTQVLPTDIVPEWTPRTLFAHWTTEQTVVFDANGGTTPEAQRKRTIGTTYGTMPAATRPGYALLGWYTKASGGSAVAAGATVTAVATRTLYAHWTDRQVTTFKGNGGTPSTQKTTNTIYSAYGELPVSKRSGNVFLGWFTKPEGGSQVTAASQVTLAAARTLYAHWTDQQVVTFKGNGGTPSTQKTTNTIYSDYGTFPSVSWTNHVFLGWYTAPDGGKRVYTNSTVTLAGTRTFYARWALDLAVHGDFNVDAATGNDANSGRSWKEAKASIQSAIDDAEDGDRIVVYNGVYGPISTVHFNRYPNGKAVEIISVNGAKKTIIDGSSSQAAHVACLGNRGMLDEPAGPQAVLEGFTIRGGHATGGLSPLGAGAFGGVLRKCIVTGNQTQGAAGGGVAYAICEGCTISGNKSTEWIGGGAFQCTLTDCIIEDNEAAGNGGGSVGGRLERCIVRRNKSAKYGGGHTGSDAVDCLFVGNEAVLGGGAVASANLSRCTVVNNRTDGSGGGAIGSILHSSILWNNTAGGQGDNCDTSRGAYNDTEPPLPGRGNISADPRFRDASAGDYRLSPDSPCIGAGFGPTDTGRKDLAGKRRRQGARVDMGAYEYSASTPAAAPSDYWVDAVNGRDTANGLSRNTPMASIQAVAEKAADGSTIHVLPGTYAPFTLDGRTLTLQATSGAEITRIDGRGTEQCAWLGTGSESILDGLTLCNGHARYGGGVWGGTLRGCVIRNNTSESDGAGAVHARLERCIVRDNSTTAGSGGGAIWCDLSDCLVYRNSAVTGGGIWSDGHFVVNCTVVGNTAEQTGGGIMSAGYVTNSIVWGNSAPDSPNLWGCDEWHVCSPDAEAGNGSITADPLFVDAAAGDFRLRAGSPCIDAGGDKGVLGETDLADHARIFGQAVDIGAYEHGAGPLVRLDPQGGSGGTASVMAFQGSAMPAISVPARKGYGFEGYFSGQGGTGTQYYTAAGASARAWDRDASATLFAYWRMIQTVTFDANGGSCSVGAHKYRSPGTYGTLPQAARSGHAFLGWFTAAEGGKQVTGDSAVTAAETRTLWAHWTDRQTTVFKGNGGSPKTQTTTNTIYAQYGELPDAARSGHVLVGWYTAADGGKRVYTNSTVTLAALRTLYAHWTDQQVVTFKGNGGTPSAQKTTNTIYAKYGAFPSVSWANHVFLGWYTAAAEGDGKRVYTNSTVTLAGTRTLWAQWTDKQVVTFRGNGGSPDVQRLTNTMGKAYGTLPEPKRSGHVFQGWFTAEEGGTQVKGTDKATAATARTLWAHWTDRQVTVFKGNGGTPKTQRMTNTIYAAYGELPTATLSGHVLTGWYTAADGGKRVYTNSTVTLAALRTLYAHWSDRQVVTFKGNGGTPSTQKTTNTIYAKYGAFPSVSWANHVFLGWYTAASEGDGKRVYTNSTVTLAGTRTLWAQWTDKQVVTFRGNGGSPDVQRHTNTMGKAYGTLPEPKRSGHVFQGWFTAEEGGTQVKGTDKATAATARTLYAHWTGKQVVTFKGNGGTPSTQKTTNTIYAAYGTLPSATRSGQVLEGWYTAADGGKRVYTNSTVTLAAARTLYAHWTDQQVVTFKGNGGRPGTQKTTNTIYAKYGAFPSVEWSGHVFQGWYNAAEGGKRVYTNSTVTLAATRTLYAHWTTGRGFAITAIAVGAGDGDEGPAPRAVRGEARAENVCRLRFELSAGTEYEIQWTPSMSGEWETVERLVAETDGEVEVEIEVPGGEKGFFRLVVFGDAGEAD